MTEMNTQPKLVKQCAGCGFWGGIHWTGCPVQRSYAEAEWSRPVAKLPPVNTASRPPVNAPNEDSLTEDQR